MVTRHADIVFFGSSDFSLPSLAALITAGHTIRLAVTTPPGTGGRGRAPIVTPVAEFAAAHGIPCVWPSSLRREEETAGIVATPHDFGIVASYGKIIPERILGLSAIMPLNVHPSRLPRYRGASPIQYALLNGDRTTAVTIMKMVARLDAGEIITREEVPIDDADTFATLAPRLASIGARLLVESIDTILAGRAVLVPQDDEKATYTRMIAKDDGLVVFAESAASIVNKVRAYTPWPSAYAFIGGRRIKFTAIRVVGIGVDMPPGTVLSADAKEFVVAVGDAAIAVERVQPEGKSEMTAGDFARGFRGLVGSRFASVKSAEPA